MELLLSPMSWGSPLGVGVFLICLGLFLFLLKKAELLDDKKNDRK